MAKSGTGGEPKKEAVQRLRQALEGGENWYIAILEAARDWPLQEGKNGANLTYLIGREALDWLALVERVSREVDGLLPEGELRELLFQGKPPLELSWQEFRQRLGEARYRGYLNFFYGVMVEEALILATQAELRKKRWCQGYPRDDCLEEAFQQLYAAPRQELWAQFCEQKGSDPQRRASLQEVKEFTYWLFKRRLGLWDKARVASDTKKGLEHFHRQRQLAEKNNRYPKEV